MKSKLLSSLVAAGLFAGWSQMSAADAAPKAPTPAAPAAAPKAPAAPTAAAREIKITAGIGEAAHFDIATIEAKPGEQIKVTLTNAGTMAKASMGHNWVLLKQGVDPMQFSIAAVQAVATDYIPDAMKDGIIAHTKLLGPKESDSVTFAAPTAPGEYNFLCSFSAHYMLGMKGTLVVK